MFVIPPESARSKLQTGSFSRISAGPGTEDSLVARLAAEMAERWRAGESPRTEEYLESHPELWQQPGGAIDLVYEEICLRQEHGQEVEPAEYLERFPQWRAQLEVLLDCHRLFEPPSAEPRQPGVGEMLGDFRLLAELGRGAQGCVFLAAQTTLADRPVVLKVTPRDGREHLSLARLQHTHIVPLYTAWDDPERNLRVLCMPYFGSATLGRVLGALKQIPVHERTGRQLIDALDAAGADSPVALPAQGPARQFLGRVSYIDAVCLIGARLAEALHRAHECGLVHLDLKPSNVLLSSDGVPMLLDFHLAQPPLRPDRPAPEWLGGTIAFMSREQHAAMAAVRDGKPIPMPVDGRADIFSLGALLYGALGGQLPFLPGVSPPLRKVNPRLALGLSDIIQKCLARDAADRYPSADLLAADLHRQRSNEKLLGVTNRSWRERWQKWRRRSPNSLLAVGVALVALAVALAVGGQCWSRLEEAQADLDQGRDLALAGRAEEGLPRLQRGAEIAASVPFLHLVRPELVRELEENLALTRRALHGRQLHDLVDSIRVAYGGDYSSPNGLHELEAGCRVLWEKRGAILEGLTALPEKDRRQVEIDLLELAVLWTDLRVRLACADEAAATRHEALRVLAETEATFGPSVVLYRERQRHAEALGQWKLAEEASRSAAALAPRSAWEHYSLGRSRLRDVATLPALPGLAGAFQHLAQSLASAATLVEASHEFDRALAGQPDGVWPNFYFGSCAYRLQRYEDAVAAFSVCIGSTRQAPFFYLRAQAHAALGRAERAVTDFDYAAHLQPKLEPNRADLYFKLALGHYGKGDHAAALRALEQVLKHNPSHIGVRELQAQLRP